MVSVERSGPAQLSYKFPLFRPVEATQLLWEIGDETGLNFGSHGDPRRRGGATGRGYELELIVYEEQPSAAAGPPGLRGGQPPVGPFVLGPLSDDQLEHIRRVIDAHQPRPPTTWQGPHRDVITHYERSVGRLLVENADGIRLHATGFLCRDRSFILTAKHVVDPDQELRLLGVEFGDKQVRAEIVELDPKVDIGVLRLVEPINGSPLHPANWAAAQWGTECIVLGYPNIGLLEPVPTIYLNTIAAVRRSYTLGHDLVELSTLLGAGFSGAPVMSVHGQLIGMVTSFPGNPDERWSAMALPPEILAAWADRISKP